MDMEGPAPLQHSSDRAIVGMSIGMPLCLLPGPRRRSRIWVRQATKNQQTLTRNPAKGEQGFESLGSGPANPDHGFKSHRHLLNKGHRDHARKGLLESGRPLSVFRDSVEGGMETKDGQGSG